MPSAVIRFEAVVPKGFGLDESRFNREVRTALNHGLNLIDGDFKAVAATWGHKPRFKTERAKREGGTLTGFVGTDDPIYRFVSGGTRPHVIRPKRKPNLVFRRGYKAKTRPGVIGSRAGGSSGGFRRSKGVNHPGTAARDFEITIATRRRRTMERLLRAAFLKALIPPERLRV